MLSFPAMAPVATAPPPRAVQRPRTRPRRLLGWQPVAAVVLGARVQVQEELPNDLATFAQQVRSELEAKRPQHLSVFKCVLLCSEEARSNPRP